MLVNVGTAGQLALLSRTSLYVHLIEWLFAWHPFKNGFVFSAVWLTRHQFGMSFLDQLGLVLMDMSDLLELSKGLSKIGAKIFESLWFMFKLRTSKSPFLFSINTDLVPNLSTSSHFAYTYINCYLFFTRS